MLFRRVSLFWFFVFQKYNTTYELKPVVFSSSCSYSVCIIMVMARLKNGIIGVKSLKPFPGYFSGAPHLLGGKVSMETSGILQYVPAELGGHIMFFLSIKTAVGEIMFLYQ